MTVRSFAPRRARADIHSPGQRGRGETAYASATLCSAPIAPRRASAGRSIWRPGLLAKRPPYMPQAQPACSWCLATYAAALPNSRLSPATPPDTQLCCLPNSGLSPAAPQTHSFAASNTTRACTPPTLQEWCIAASYYYQSLHQGPSPTYPLTRPPTHMYIQTHGQGLRRNLLCSYMYI
eukprot:357678-Chlamydomonas_euryale.AAC.7